MQEMLDLCVDAGMKAQSFFRIGKNDGELSAGRPVLAA